MDGHRSPAALIELLTALRWTSVDEIVVDLCQLDAIDLRVAGVLARATRHHADVGRRIALVCPTAAMATALHAVGLDGPETLYPSLAAAGWHLETPRASGQPRRHRVEGRPQRSGALAGVGS
jgi:anti-anti-sigma regulatory factor